MRSHVFYPFSRVKNSVGYKKAALILATLLLAGCSSNTMRFTDGMFTNSTSGQQVDNRPMPTQPIPPVVTAQNQAIESRELPPMAENTTMREEQPVQMAGLGAPPRNLGTLPASEVNANKPPVVAKSDDADASQRYIVQSGDTLSRIAARRNVSVAKLREANSLSTDKIRIGQALTIPATKAETRVAMAQPPATPPVTPVVHNTAIVSDPVSTPSKPEESDAVHIVKAEPKEQKTPKVEQVAVVTPTPNVATGLRWPAKGRILSSFGQREGTLTNDGVDIMVPEGTPVKAAESGVVIYAGDGLKEFGNTILIRHEDNLVTVYGHNGQLLVQRGQKVRRGDEIAKSGKSGNTATPKLHFEVRKNSTPVNPIKYLES